MAIGPRGRARGELCDSLSLSLYLRHARWGVASERASERVLIEGGHGRFYGNVFSFYLRAGGRERGICMCEGITRR